MNRLNTPIILIALTLVMVVGLRGIKDDEKVQESVVLTTTAEERMAVPAARSKESDVQGYQDNEGTPTIADAVRDTSTGTVQTGEPGKADRVGESREEPPIGEQQPDAASGPPDASVATESQEPVTARNAPVADAFDYSKIQSLYVLKGDRGYLYASFPLFLEYRAMIARKMSAAEESNVDFTKMIYEVRAVGIGEETTLFIGDAWMDDGERSAQLSDEELNWLRWAYESRSHGSSIDREEIEAAVRSALDEQRDPAWRPAP